MRDEPALSGLELRKAACNALGWTEGDHTFWCVEHGERETVKLNTLKKAFSHYAAIESDPAVSEPMFLEWCQKKGLAWQMTSTRQGATICVIFIGDPNSNDEANVGGTTPSEARARAIVAASLREKENR